MPTVWISVLISLGCFKGSKATGSVFQLFRKPGAVGGTSTRKTHIHAHTTWGKIELTLVKLGATYYGIVDVERKMEITVVNRRRVLRYVAVDDILCISYTTHLKECVDNPEGAPRGIITHS